MQRSVESLDFAQIHRVFDSPNYYGIFLHCKGVDSLQRRRALFVLRLISYVVKVITAKTCPALRGHATAPSAQTINAVFEARYNGFEDANPTIDGFGLALGLEIRP